jgi:hypothetical protein
MKKLLFFILVLVGMASCESWYDNCTSCTIYYSYREPIPIEMCGDWNFPIDSLHTWIDEETGDTLSWIMHCNEVCD